MKAQLRAVRTFGDDEETPVEYIHAPTAIRKQRKIERLIVLMTLVNTTLLVGFGILFACLAWKAKW